MKFWLMGAEGDYVPNLDEYVMDSPVHLPWQKLPGYQQVVIAVIVALTILVPLFWTSVVDIIAVWRSSETYSHCFFILPIMFYLLYSRRDHLTSTAQPDIRMVLLVVPPLLLWLTGVVAEINIFIHAGFVGVFLAATLALLGMNLVRQSWPYVVFLVFLTPFGDEVVPYLVDVTADFTVGTLRALSFPIYREGNHFTMSTGNWSVVEACSGVRYLMASVTLGYVYALLNYSKHSKQLIFLLVSAIVPIIANGLRAVIIVLLGHYSGMTLATGVDHLIYGWLFFGIVVFGLFWAGRRWQDPEPEVATSASETVPVKALKLGSTLKTLAALVIVVAVPVAWVKTINFYADLPTPVFELYELKSNTENSISSEERLSWAPDFLPGDQAEVATLESTSGSNLHLLLMTYGTSEQGNELVSTRNALVRPGNRESVLLSQRERMVDLDGKAVKVWQGKVRHGISYYSVSYFLLVNNKPVNSFAKLKFIETSNRLLNRPQPVRVLFSIDSVGDEGQLKYHTDKDLADVYSYLLARSS